MDAVKYTFNEILKSVGAICAINNIEDEVMVGDGTVKYEDGCSSKYYFFEINNGESVEKFIIEENHYPNEENCDDVIFYVEESEESGYYLHDIDDFVMFLVESINKIKK